jgi:cytoskeletal protein RodZ
MRLPIRILLITMLFIPALLIAQESNPEKPLENSEPSADSEPSANNEPSASSNKEPSATNNNEPQETQDDRDFKPSEEISEDFPVPLPSDI